MADVLLKILVSRLRFIGDIVLTTPVLEILREKFPDATIDYLGDSEGVTLLYRNPNLSEIIPYNFSAPEVIEQFRVASLLRRRKYDVAIDLFGNPRSAVEIFLSGAKMRIGGDFGWRGRLFTHPVAVKERITAVDFHLRYLLPLGIHEGYRQPRIFLDDNEIRDAEEFLEQVGVGDTQRKAVESSARKLMIGLHIGATWPAKVWMPEYFARLAELIAGDLDAQVVVTYGPRDSGYLERFLSSTQARVVVIPPRDLRRLAAIISRCGAYVSNDAAPMHISTAVGTRTIGIFGPGEPDIWFPYEKSLGHVALHKDVQCCHSDRCDMSGEDYMKCMKAIKPEEVFETLKQILEIG